MKLLLSFMFVLTFFVVPQASHAQRKVRGQVQCCTPSIIKRGEQCDTTCTKTNSNARTGIKNRGNVPCCDTPGLNPAWQCNTSCSAFDYPARRCNDAMRRAGRCE